MSRGIKWRDDLETVMGPKDATTGEAHDDAQEEHESFGTERDDGANHHIHNQALPEEAQELSNANNLNENHNAGSDDDDDDDDMLGSLLK